MEDQDIDTLHDALRDVPGVGSHTGEDTAAGDNITIRGFSALTDFFLDGLRDYGAYYRDPFNLQEVDVLKGPSGLLFGQGSTGGVVSQVSKMPELQASYAGSLGFGTDMTSRATADINQPLSVLGSNTALRLNVVSDEGGVAERDVVQNSTTGLAPTLSFGIGTPTRLTLSYFHLNENDIPDYGIPWLLNTPAPVSRNLFYGFGDDFLRITVDMETLKFEQDLGDSFTFSNKTRYSNYIHDIRVTDPQIAPADQLNIVNGTLSLNQAMEEPRMLPYVDTDTDFNNQTDLTVKFQTAGIRHTLTGGMEVIDQTADPNTSSYTGVPSELLLYPSESQFFTGVEGPVTQVSASVNTLSFYGMDTIDLDKNWELVGGLRWDGSNSSYTKSINGTVSAFNRVDNMLNWRAGLIFKPQFNGSIYFVSGTSTDPSAEQLSLSAATENDPPEQNITYEFGTKWDLMNNRLHLTGDLFWDEQTNSRILDTNPSDSTYNQDLDAGDERVEGFEMGIAGNVTPLWSVLVGYTYLDSEYVNYVSSSGNFTGLPLANTPQNSLDVWTTYEFLKGFQLGGGTDWVSSRNAGAFASNKLLETVPDYVIFSAMVKYRVDKNISLQANAINLTDVYYIDEVDDSHALPGAGRTLLVSTNFKF
jgi:catecholate siderophore receptor